MSEVRSLGTKCPYCFRIQRDRWYIHGKSHKNSLGHYKTPEAAVIQCEFCKKDFFSEWIHASVSYRYENEEGDLAPDKIEVDKEKYGYVDDAAMKEFWDRIYAVSKGTP